MLPLSSNASASVSVNASGCLLAEAEHEPCAFCHVLQQSPQLFDAKSSARVNRTRRETQRAQSVCPFVVATCDAILLQFRCIFRRLVVTDDVP
jgi:hypothetical protein